MEGDGRDSDPGRPARVGRAVDSVPATAQLALRARRAPSARPPDETALVRAAQRGSAAAFEELFALHWPAAHRAAYLVFSDPVAAEDIAQEAFLAAVRALDRFDRRRPFGPWLHRIVVNRAIDYARARAVRRELGADALPEAPAVEEPPADGELAAALAALPDEQRAVVVLRHLLGYAPGDIARMLELPRGTVNSRLRRGLDALARVLDPEAAR
jgi:RNA polymerase sigma-70 factor, ECF subfamily